MHSSKGLEYRIVFVVDANEGIVPPQGGLPADIEAKPSAQLKEQYHKQKSRFVKAWTEANMDRTVYGKEDSNQQKERPA